jgi:hypothetical protein
VSFSQIIIGVDVSMCVQCPSYFIANISFLFSSREDEVSTHPTLLPQQNYTDVLAQCNMLRSGRLGIHLNKIMMKEYKL